jgi:ATP-dependent protease ClpP protease subunit
MSELKRNREQFEECYEEHQEYSKGEEHCNKKVCVCNNNDVFDQFRYKIYKSGNEIHFSTGIDTNSIQRIIKEIQDLINEHQKTKKGQKLTISYTIDSPGGSVLSVLKFVDFINVLKKKYPFIEFVSIITGLAASAGTIMALTGHKRLMTKNAYAMIHELSGVRSGTYTHMKSQMILVDDMHNRLTDMYLQVMDRTKEEVEQLLKNETWMTAEQYKEIGLVTEVI